MINDLSQNFRTPNQYDKYTYKYFILF